LIENEADIKILQIALDEVVARHDILRTSFVRLSGLMEPLQVIGERNNTMLQHYDLSGAGAATQQQEIKRIFDQALQRPFNLEEGPALSAELITLTPSRHYLILSLPSLCADAGTLNNLVREISESYSLQFRHQPDDDEPMRYIVISEWLNELLDSEEVGLDYWDKQDWSAATDSPAVVTHSARDGGEFVPASADVAIKEEVAIRLGQVAQQHNVSISTLLLTCWQALLWRLSGREQIIVGVTFDGRTDEELENAFGPLARYLPVSCRIEAAMTLYECLKQAGAITDRHSEWQDYFSWGLGETSGEPPFFPACFDFQESMAIRASAGITFSIVDKYTCSERFEIKLVCDQRDGELFLRLYYDSGVISSNDAARLAAHFEALVSSAACNPDSSIGELEIISETERRQLLFEFNDTAVEFRDDAIVHRLFEKQAARTPHNIAVAYEALQITYAVLNARANQLACYLKSVGVGPESLVALCMERSIELVIAMLGVLKAGAAYVPLDPSYPKDRLAFMLADARSPVILTQDDLSDILPESAGRLICLDGGWEVIGRYDDTDVLLDVNPDHPAYVLYTSGTTGNPKGVIVTHSSLRNHMLWMLGSFPLVEGDRVLQKTPFSFDASVWEFYLPLLSGAELIMARPGGHQNSHYLVSQITHGQVTTLQVVPALLRLLLDEPGFSECNSLRRVFYGGEPLSAQDQQRFFEHSQAELINLYGPTETTIQVTSLVCERTDENKASLIGRPIANTQIYILDNRHNPTPIGVPGELHIGGVALARGYLNRPELTAEKFVPDPFGNHVGARLYKTADLAHWLPDGNIALHGRIDYQVKIRGLRVELNEIEAVLRKHPAVSQAVVIVKRDEAGIDRLIGYIVPAEKSGQSRTPEMLSADRDIYLLPNGLAVKHYHKNETDFLYQEIFQERSYLRNGISLRDGACVFDVGANIGMFTLFVGRECKDAIIYAFEPIPPIFEILRANATLHGLKAKLFNCGVADRAKTDTFTFYHHLSMMSGRFADTDDDREIVKSFESNQRPGGSFNGELLDEMLADRLTSERFTCELVTISDVISENGVDRIDLLKIDAEKSERDVLSGIRPEDWPKIKQIVMEVQDTGGLLGQIKTLLIEHGFEVAVRQETLLRNTNLYDLFAVRPSEAGEIKKDNGHRSASPPSGWNGSDLITQIRQFAKTKLPEYMLPSMLVLLDSLPLTANGKIDRAALPAPGELEPQRGKTHEAPRTPSEELLAAIWGEVLGLEQVGIRDDFFDIGGHSLLATQVIARVREAFKLNLEFSTFFESPTVADLACIIDGRLAAGKASQLPAITRVNRDGDLPLSFAQQRLWFLEQVAPDSALYNIPLAFRIRGQLDKQALERSFNEIINRHEVLRTSFASHDGEAVQIINAKRHLRLSNIDLRALTDAELKRFIEEEANRPFDLASGPLLRVLLFDRGEREHVLLLTMHHIVSDGWSTGILMQELGRLYQAYSQNQPSPLRELQIQYADYALWQREWLRGEALDEQLDYWKRNMADAPAILELPTVRPRLAIQTYSGASYPFELPGGLLAASNALCRKQDVTLFMLLMAVFSVVMHRRTGQRDIVIGSAVANRGRKDIEPLIGLFINTLPMRVRIDGDLTFRELLAQVRDVTLGAYAHQDLPFERLVEELQPERHLSRSPLFQVMFTLQNTPMPTVELSGLDIELLGIESRTAKFDLTLSMQETAQGLSGVFTYNADLFDANMIGRIAGHFSALLDSVSANPGRHLSQLPLMTEEERDELLFDWNETGSQYAKDKCVHQIFEEQSYKLPEAVALIYEDEQLTYEELNRRANQVAHYLLKLGVAPEVSVGICMDRSPDMVVALLGILKAGGAYVPLDPNYPKDRLALMLDDAGVSVVLTQQHMLDNLPDVAVDVVCLDTDWHLISQSASFNPRAQVRADNLIYIIYTSGSTGKPKGAMLPHRGIVNCLMWLQKTYGLKEDDRVMLKASLSFDASVWELFWPLLVGAGVVIARPGGHYDSRYLIDAINHRQVTTVHFVPAMLRAFLQEEGLETLTTLKRVIVGGEALSVETMEQFFARLTSEFHNFYGPTETSIGSTDWRCKYQTNAGIVPIGKPIANTQAYVLDPYFAPVTAGVAGELCISGDGLARGYLNEPGLTSEKFIVNPFAGRQGARLYRTGDLARYLPDGNIEFLGRIDLQVKIRGFRIEPGEIESVLSRHESVNAAVVLLREDRPGEKKLVAYITAVTDSRLTASDLRAFLRDKLPDYMMPSAFVLIESLPLMPNGKVNRKALPMPDYAGIDDEETFIGPRTVTEEVLEGLWCQVLNVSRVGMTEDFFALGGHSLLATRIISRVHKAFNIELPVRSVFENPSPEGFASLIDKAIGIRRREPESLIPRADRNLELPLSFAQQRLWFLDQLEPNNAAYNMPVALRLKGVINIAAMRKSLDEIVRRHEILRTVFSTVDGRPIQLILPPSQFMLPVIDLCSLDAAEQEAKAYDLAYAEAHGLFNLAEGPLLRAAILKLGEQEHVFLLTMHHIISDGWSVEIFVKEFIALYEEYCSSSPASLPDLPIQYADFALWQREWLQGDVLETQLAYWRSRLSGAPAMLELPTDRPRPAEHSGRGASQTLSFDQALAESLKSLSRREEATLFMVLLACFKALLYRYTGQEDLCVGVPIANRNRVETESLIGFFANTLVLRTEMAGRSSFRDLLQQVRAAAFGAYSHQDIPFEIIVDDLQPERSLSHGPLFQVMFILQNVWEPTTGLTGLSVTTLDVANETAKFDLTLSMSETEEGLSCQINYSTDLFDFSTIDRMLRHFEAIVKDIVEAPQKSLSELRLMTDAERRHLVTAWNMSRAAYPKGICIHEIFESQVEETPERVVITSGEEQLSFAELNRRANRLAHFLRRQGAGPEVMIGILLERSISATIAILAALKSGGGYVPLDPSYPESRLAFMIKDARMPLVITERRHSNLFSRIVARIVYMDEDGSAIAECEEGNLTNTASPENVACLIYTSGSTGSPKGVMSLHMGAVNRLTWGWKTHPFHPGEVCCQKTALSFVDSIAEIFAPLLQGITSVIIADTDAKDPLRLIEILERHSVTRIVLVPSLLKALLDSLQVRLQNLKYLVSSGEALPVSLFGQARQKMPETILINLYGSSEVSADASWFDAVEYASGQTVPIGRPVSNTELYLLDSHSQVAPAGITGELFIAGDNLSRGYYEMPNLTAEKFIPNMFATNPGERLYRTGDLAKYLPDGSLVHLGRIDNQIKLRGLRIEPSEIETVLKTYPSVLAAIVTVRRGPDDEKSIVAYFVKDGQQQVTSRDLREFLAERLPDYMIPAWFVPLDALPLTPNGKLDRRSLPSPDRALSEMKDDFIGPRDSIELQLTQIWESLLDFRPVGVRDNFFHYGGNSILAVRLMSRIADAFGVSLPVAALFRGATIEQLSVLLRRENVSLPETTLVALSRGGSKKPFFCVHGIGGNVLGFADVSIHLGPDQPFYGLQSKGLDGKSEPDVSIEEMASQYIEAVCTVQAEGPYLLGGFSMGGVVAFEMAQQLKRRGEEVELLALFDSRGEYGVAEDETDDASLLFRLLGEMLPVSLQQMQALSPDERLNYLIEVAKAERVLPPDIALATIRTLFEITKNNMAALRNYVPQAYTGRVTLFRASEDLAKQERDESLGWEKLAMGGVEIIPVPGSHNTMILKPNVETLAERLRECLKGR
jgi:amino acid adenylation domain-containing protein/FkbM family methyltransferase